MIPLKWTLSRLREGKFRRPDKPDLVLPSSLAPTFRRARSIRVASRGLIVLVRHRIQSTVKAWEKAT